MAQKKSIFRETGGQISFAVDENTTAKSLIQDCDEDSWKENRVRLFKDAVPRCTNSAVGEFKSVIIETLSKKRSMGDMGFVYSPSLITDASDKTLDVLEREVMSIITSRKMDKMFAKHGVKAIKGGVREVKGVLSADPTVPMCVVHVLYLCLVTEKFIDEVIKPLHLRALLMEEEARKEAAKKRSQSNAPSLD
jgi:hypothetical protein